MPVSIQTADFDMGDILKTISAKPGVGAVVSFTGVVRNNEETTLKTLELECYPAMAQSALEAIEKEAIARWNLNSCQIIHRYGALKPQEQIMMVVTASAHRSDAFDAAEFLMDYLKSRAPFWKKEHLKTGENYWVDAKEADEDSLARWQS